MTPYFDGLDLWLMAGAMYFCWIALAPVERWPRWWRFLTDPATWAHLRACLPRSTLAGRR